MKQGLIDPNTQVFYISAWQNPAKEGEPYTPVYTEVSNSDRLAEVADAPFEVAPPLFWVECPDDAVADQWYYNNVQQQVLLKPADAPYPVGAVTL
jgi:hypothetical protein